MAGFRFGNEIGGTVKNPPYTRAVWKFWVKLAKDCWTVVGRAGGRCAGGSVVPQQSPAVLQCRIDLRRGRRGAPRVGHSDRQRGKIMKGSLLGSYVRGEGGREGSCVWGSFKWLEKMSKTVDAVFLPLLFLVGIATVQTGESHWMCLRRIFFKTIIVLWRQANHKICKLIVPKYTHIINGLFKRFPLLLISVDNLAFLVLCLKQKYKRIQRSSKCASCLMSATSLMETAPGETFSEN